MCTVGLAAGGETRDVPGAAALDAALACVAPDPLFRACFTAEGDLRPTVRVLLNDALVVERDLSRVDVGADDEVLLIRVFAGG